MQNVIKKENSRECLHSIMTFSTETLHISIFVAKFWDLSVKMMDALFNDTL